MGITPNPLVRTIFALFLCVLNILLVVLVVWCMVFLHQYESIPNVIFLHLTCSYQYDSNTKVVDSSKTIGPQIPYSFPNLKLGFIFIVIV